MRIGHGYDVHRLKKDRKLILGGVEIPYKKGLAGHSDADVLLHAVMDALLGASALKDIGQHFPDSDPAYKGISSLVLLSEVGKMLDEKGLLIENIDATVIAQKPKLSPYTEEMKKNISETLGITADRVNVKATTEEGLGFTGKGRGIAAHAVCLLISALEAESCDVTPHECPACPVCGIAEGSRTEEKTDVKEMPEEKTDDKKAAGKNKGKGKRKA